MFLSVQKYNELKEREPKIMDNFHSLHSTLFPFYRLGCPKRITKGALRDLTFSQRFCCKFRSSAVWRCLVRSEFLAFRRVILPLSSGYEVQEQLFLHCWHSKMETTDLHDVRKYWAKGTVSHPRRTKPSTKGLLMSVQCFAFAITFGARTHTHTHTLCLWKRNCHKYSYRYCQSYEQDK